MSEPLISLITDDDYDKKRHDVQSGVRQNNQRHHFIIYISGSDGETEEEIGIVEGM